MKLVGFGCSFTYGSELIDPNIDEWDQHYSNIKYRESHVWLGLLAKRLGCTFDNRAEPANSNYAIGQQVTEYIRSNQENLADITICIAWTERTRMSWYDDHWTHNGFAGEQKGWSDSAREWVLKHTSQSLDMFTDNAKLIANSVCHYYNVPIIQFNALGKHRSDPYTNYLLNGGSMDSYLRRKQEELNRDHEVLEEVNYFASGMHPNERGHEVWTDQLVDWIKGNNLVR